MYLRLTLLAGACLGLAACDSTSDSTPAKASAPAFAFTLSEVPPTVFEKQPARIAVATKTGTGPNDHPTFTVVIDEGGDSLTVGPVAAPGESWHIATHAVDADVGVRGRVIGTLGNQTREQPFSFEIKNYARTPINAQWHEPHSRPAIADKVVLLDLAGLDKATRRPAVFAFTRIFATVVSSPEGQIVLRDVFSEVPLTTPGKVEKSINLDLEETKTWPDARFILFTQHSADSQHAVIYSQAMQSFVPLSRQMNLSSSNRPEPFTAAPAIRAPGLCAVHQIRRRDARGHKLPYLDLLIGTPTGLLIAPNLANDSLLNHDPHSFGPPQAVAGARGNFCNLLSLSSNYSHPVLRYDPETGALGLIRPTRTGPLALIDLPPLAYTPPAGQNFVAMGSGHDADDVGFIALLFSDGQHDGRHTLVLRRADEDTVMPPTEHKIELPAGVPTALFVGEIDLYADPSRPEHGPGDGLDHDDDIVIAVPGTPYVYVVEIDNLAPGSSQPYALSFFETGFDVFDLTVNPYNPSSRALITAARPNTITLWRNKETDYDDETQP